MRDAAPAGHWAGIQTCRTPEKFVVSLRDIAPDCDVRLASPNGSGRFQCSARIGQADINDMDSLVDALWTLHGQVICESRFSFVQRQWRQFTDEEIEKIDQALNRTET